MPYTKKQNKLFQAAAHSPKVAKKAGIPMKTASKMAKEGVSKPKAKSVKVIKY